MVALMGGFRPVECDTPNWTGGWCRKVTRQRCPYCFGVTCSVHKFDHAAGGTRLVCQGARDDSERADWDWELIRQGNVEAARRDGDQWRLRVLGAA